MIDFSTLVKKTGEIGEVSEVHQTLLYISGLPDAKPQEFVLFESGQRGQILSLKKDYVEALLLSNSLVGVGTKVARLGRPFELALSSSILGQVIDPLGNLIIGKPFKKTTEFRPVDVRPPGIRHRKNLDQPFETGVAIVDLLVPLGKGQRELVIGDRKTGKTELLLQSCLNQLKKGTIVIYAAIAKRRVELKQLHRFFEEHEVLNNLTIVNSYSSDPPGLTFLAPYSAMTIAEYFRDKGKDVLVVLDDMTTHAKFYREISLLAKRFPGRSSYPGDIFFVHAKLMERAGNFQKGSITALPVAETVLGDISGYISTNLMSMTDGHIYFDTDLYNKGRRPAVNTFLSVTRVGLQTQTPLVRDISRKLGSFMTHVDELRQFMHFGAELSDKVRQTLSLGERIENFFQQAHGEIYPFAVTVIVISALWAGYWKEINPALIKKEIDSIIIAYNQNAQYKQLVDNVISNHKTFEEIVSQVGAKPELLARKVSTNG